MYVDVGSSCESSRRKLSWIGVARNTRTRLPFFFISLNHCVWMMTLRLSIKKMPQSSGSNSSLWMMTAHTPMMPPMVSEPVSPMKICAG